MKVVLQAPVSEITDNGKDGTGLAIALHNWGFDVHLLPTCVIPPVHPFIAKLLTRPPLLSYDLEFTIWPEEDATKDIGFTVVWREYSLALGYEASIWKPVQRDWLSDKLNYCVVVDTTYSNAVTKSCSVVLDAFSELRESHPEFKAARLNIKGDVEIEAEGVTVYKETLSSRTLQDFYSDQHVLLALEPERNLSAIEFASTGGAVIAAAWEENKSWLSSEYAYPLVLNDENLDKEKLKEIMWHVFNNRAELNKKGQIAANVIPQMLDWEKVLERLFHKLDRVPEARLYSQKAMYLRAQEATNREREQ